MSTFDALAGPYDLARPDYPASLYDALERLTGPLAGRTVLELGAGTGIATRALTARGAEVLAVDVAARMLERLRRRGPATPAVLARAEALPVAGAGVDLVCGAQMWHWVDVPAAVGEARRVLRPGGALAVWWNDVAGSGIDWWEAQQERLESAGTGYHRDYRTRDHAAELGRYGRVTVWRTRWERRLDLPTYEQWLRSKSYVAALGGRMPAFVAAERASLAAAFPDGTVVEPFETSLFVLTPGV